MILVPVPDAETRLEIFKVHTKKMALAGDVNLDELVRITEDFTGADIAAVCKKAGRFAMREDIKAEKIRMEHFQAAIEDTGPSVTSDIMGYYEKLKDELRKKRSKQIESRPEMYV
jgi:transitional endoplasmic reticulum ATPase